ncbi:ESCRT-II complex subunit-domain-containing protein [Phycomyces blakesleeanus]|uniref:Vacuolar protein-sorting-associated protein 25 n=2 Tax=Phycomyces blakesleeanus TaxID=4837 RepID=A0A167MJN7_PHYB8|nr:hypothetical protein PHYBLDRAFT_177674 [Phycomyces blakesleeanus NRRL 1555(-)]OAD73034.1 hypothetical protein PHYBLDRAFT_177674 [Phycomyces blakesleeanus NRRL 1555(-)]|eukprot:XP_018291074.1 hypothetical protein PHYBLDRAFT_177674 [Phycomyces blakesleeanus NRRL 1555(-)]
MPDTSFEFPLMHGFPPFYTRQPTEATWESQIGQWSQVILNYARHHRIFKLDLQQSTSPGGSDLFENTKIKRRLSFETLQEIIQAMTVQGTAEWEHGPKGPKDHAYIFWRRPEEWATLIWEWVNTNGLNNTVVTLYEITEGDLSEGQEFYGIDSQVLIMAIKVLVKRGDAQLLEGNEGYMGVKFFG